MPNHSYEQYSHRNDMNMLPLALNLTMPQVREELHLLLKTFVAGLVIGLALLILQLTGDATDFIKWAVVVLGVGSLIITIHILRIVMNSTMLDNDGAVMNIDGEPVLVTRNGLYLLAGDKREYLPLVNGNFNMSAHRDPPTLPYARIVSVTTNNGSQDE